MADVFEAISAASSLVDLSIRLIKKVIKAYERQKDLVNVLETHTAKLNDLKKLIRVLVEEESLQTARMSVYIVRLKETQMELNVCLKKLDPGRESKVMQTARQLLKGPRDEDLLAHIMAKIEDAKRDLCFCIQVANVGLYQSIGEKVVVIAEVVRRIDRTLIQLLGEGSGLKIAQLLNKRPLNEDGHVILTKEELASLSVEGPSAPNESTGTAGQPPPPALDRSHIERIIIGNMARDEALQVNGPVGADMWDGMTVRVENNVASGMALQVNYQTHRDDFRSLQAEQRSRLEADERRQARLAQDRKEERGFEERRMLREAEERKQIREMEERLQRMKAGTIA